MSVPRRGLTPNSRKAIGAAWLPSALSQTVRRPSWRSERSWTGASAVGVAAPGTGPPARDGQGQPAEGGA